MIGIGAIIIVLQVLTILGADPVPEGPLVQIAAWPDAIDDDTACVVLGLSGDVARTLRSLNIFRRVPDRHFVDSLEDAKRLSKHLLRERSADGSALII